MRACGACDAGVLVVRVMRVMRACLYRTNEHLPVRLDQRRAKPNACLHGVNLAGAAANLVDRVHVNEPIRVAP